MGTAARSPGTVDDRRSCPACGRPVEEGSPRCSECGALLLTEPGEPSPGPDPRSGVLVGGITGHQPPDLTKSAADLTARVERLRRWATAAREAGAELPTVPPWAERAASASGRPDVWNEALRRLEAEVRRRSAVAMDRLRDRLTPRIARLEAYAVDTHDERDRLDEAARAARRGELDDAFGALRQLASVVEIKEHHLDQLRSDLERFLSLVRDLEAIGVALPESSQALAATLEAQLKAGRVAALRQRIRASRGAATDALRSALPGYVRRVADRLTHERERGLVSDSEIRTLAEAARCVILGDPEDGVRLLRRVGAPRGFVGTPEHRPASPARPRAD